MATGGAVASLCTNNFTLLNAVEAATILNLTDPFTFLKKYTYIFFPFLSFLFVRLAKGPL